MSQLPAERAPRHGAPARGFALVEALVALVILGAVVAAVMPGLALSLRAKFDREATLAAVLAAQSLLDAYAPPGAAREGRREGRLPEGDWLVEVGPGEPGARGVVLRPVRVTLGMVTLETLRPGPAEEAAR